MKKYQKPKKSRNTPYFYMFSKKLYKKNNKIYTKGYINGKRINKTKKIKY